MLCCLVLSPTTGLVSLQFHVTFDDFFKTTCFNHAEILLPSAWQKPAGFVHEDKYQGKSWLCEKADDYESQEKQVDHGANTHQGEQFWKNLKLSNFLQMMQILLLQIYVKSYINIGKKILKINCLLVWYKPVRAIEGEFIKSPKMMENMKQGLTSWTILGFQAVTENTKDHVFPFEDILLKVKIKWGNRLHILQKKFVTSCSLISALSNLIPNLLRQLSSKSMNMWIVKIEN